MSYYSMALYLLCRFATANIKCAPFVWGTQVDVRQSQLSSIVQRYLCVGNVAFRWGLSHRLCMRI